MIHVAEIRYGKIGMRRLRAYGRIKGVNIAALCHFDVELTKEVASSCNAIERKNLNTYAREVDKDLRNNQGN